MKICRIMSKIYGIILWPIKILCRFILWLVKIICRIISKLGESANGEKQSSTSSLDYGEDEMCNFFHDEDWKKELSSAPNKMNDIKRELESMDSEKLKAFKLKTQTNLAKATLQNRNAAVEFGIPVASLIFSILALIIPLFSNDSPGYFILQIKHFFQVIASESNSQNSNASAITSFLSIFGILMFFVFIFCEYYRFRRKHEVFYYQTILNIIESMEEKAKDADNNK